MRVQFLQSGAWRVAELNRKLDRVQVAQTGLADESPPPYLVPGLVDSHCHGVDGFDVMDGDAREIATRLRARGIEYYCPTTVVATWAEIRRALEPCRDKFGGFAGVHLEGPFINPVWAGAQPQGSVLEPDFSGLQSELGDLLDLVRITTLAPELSGSGELIAGLRDRGITVSAGHTDATYSELAGQQITRLTHFFNAMRPFHHRDPGAVGYGLSEKVSLELIYDRVHVSREAAGLAISCQEGRGCVVAVSDGTPMAGLNDGDERQMWGHRVRRDGGAVRLVDGTLAGSAVTLVEVFQNIWRDFGSLRAVQMCSTHPREELGLPAPSLWLLVGVEGNIIEILETDLEIS